MAPPETTHDYYAILAVSNTATLEEITRSYKKLALVRHPDRNMDDINATATFQLLLEAYQVLRDTTTRREYDEIWARLPGTEISPPSVPINPEAYQNRPGQHGRSSDGNSSKASYDVLTELRMGKKKQDSMVSDAQKRVDHVEASMEGSRKEEEESGRRDREADRAWWASLTSPLGGPPTETTEQKELRDAARVRRSEAVRRKESVLRPAKEELQRWKEVASDLDGMILDEEYKMQKGVEEQRQAAARRMREEQARREHEEKARSANNPQASHGCGHRFYWEVVKGPHRCDHCGRFYRRFAFECPGCSMIACAGCRTVLQRG